jgi:hypothetical protein
MDIRFIRAHDHWLTPPESKVAFCCDFCGEGIHVGEEYLECENGDQIHEDCKDDWIRKNVSFIRHTAE